MNDRENEVDPEVYRAAVDLFGGNEINALNWLQTPCLALGMIKPIDAPACQVILAINRINHGVLQ